MIWLITLLLAQAAAPTQIERGEALFFDAEHNCASCHAMKGKGTPAGPDLKEIAVLTPKGVAMSIRSTVTQYVQIVTLQSGESFPSMPPKDQPSVEIYDLSKMPPALHKVEKADIKGTAANNGWKHPPSARQFTPEEMADLVAYIRFAGANNRQPVSPDDVQ